MKTSNHYRAIRRDATLTERVIAEAKDQGKHVVVTEITPPEYDEDELELGEWYRRATRNPRW